MVSLSTRQGSEGLLDKRREVKFEIEDNRRGIKKRGGGKKRVQKEVWMAEGW